MTEAINITKVEKDDGDGVLVDFSDQTTTGYVAEELLELRSNREPIEAPAKIDGKRNGLNH